MSRHSMWYLWLTEGPRQAFVLVLRPSAVSIFPPMRHTHLHAARVNVWALQTVKQQCSFANRGVVDKIKVLCVYLSSISLIHHPFIHSLVFSLEGLAWQEQEPSHVTGMTLVHCILGKFLGVVCHCFPPPLEVPTLAARCLRPQRRERS